MRLGRRTHLVGRHLVAEPGDGATNLDRDLGFGAVVARESRLRLLNRDGSFNVAREGLPFWTSLSLYHSLLTLSWPRFLGLVVAAYFGMNLLFAGAYLACGPGAIEGGSGSGFAARVADAFFFSVQTFATIGYGKLTASGLVPNLLVTTEALFGLLTVALATGLVFARFSRPTARILASDYAVIAPYRDGRALMIRIANARSNELIDVEARLLFARFKDDGSTREFLPLKLERDQVMFFSLSWTIVHPINEESPLWGLSEAEVKAAQAEVLVLLTGFDETFSQTVHTRTSYTADEILWGAGFVRLFLPPRADGRVAIDVSRLHEVEPRELL